MIVIGAKGFAKEILEILHRQKSVEGLVFYDDVNIEGNEKLFDKFPILNTIEQATQYFKNDDSRFTIGIGNPLLRKKFYDKFNDIGGAFTSVISSNCEMGSYEVNIGVGCNILSGAVFSNSVTLGKGCLVYYNAVITHDCLIGDFAEISPGVTLLGRSNVGSYTQIGANTTVLPDIKIGNNVVIGAGSLVTKDIPDYVLAYGNPARVIKKFNNNIKGMKLSFVIPVFRNQGSIVPTYEKVTGLLKKMGIGYEFIFIEDGSDDKSIDELMQLHLSDKNVKVITFSRNFGQVSGIIAGLKEVTGEATIIMSADLQEPVELIENMILKWQSGNEIVICHREDREDSFIANTASKIFYRLMKYVNPKMPDGGFDFMLLGKNAIAVLNKIDERNRFIQGDILWLGFTTVFIPYTRLKRTIGKSQWTLSKKLKYFIDGLINSSYVPIRLMSLLGIIISLLGFLYALVIVYSRFINNTPFDGWAPIMIAILIIGGLIMLMLGIIGEYVWRTYDETRKRPLYIIKDKFIKDEATD